MIKKTPEQYLDLAKEKGFDLMGAYPANTHEKTRWRCLVCHRDYDRSYKQIGAIRGCRCQGVTAIRAEHYKLLAEALGIEWLGSSLPKRTTTSTTWRGYSGQTFNATYAELRRPHIPLRYHQYLRPDLEIPTSNYDSAEHVEILRQSFVNSTSNFSDAAK